MKSTSNLTRVLLDASRKSSIAEALMDFYRFADEAFGDKNWPAFDDALDKMLEAPINHEIAIGVLTISAPFRDKLRNRERFYLATFRDIWAGYTKERAEAALRGLE